MGGSSFEWVGYRLGSGPGRSFLPQRHFLIGRAEDVPAPPVTVAFSLVFSVLLEASLMTGLRMSGILPASVYQCRGDAQRSIWLNLSLSDLAKAKHGAESGGAPAVYFRGEIPTYAVRVIPFGLAISCIVYDSASLRRASNVHENVNCHIE